MDTDVHVRASGYSPPPAAADAAQTDAQGTAEEDKMLLYSAARSTAHGTPRGTARGIARGDARGTAHGTARGTARCEAGRAALALA